MKPSIGPSRPADAQITYYQKGRHIFGDLKIEIFDQDGKLVDTRSRQQASGTEPRQLVDAAEASGYCSRRRRRCLGFTGTARAAGNLPVKLTKGDKTYTGPLRCCDGSARQVFAWMTARRSSSLR